MTLSFKGKEKVNEDKSEYDKELKKKRTVAHTMEGAQAIN